MKQPLLVALATANATLLAALVALVPSGELRWDPPAATAPYRPEVPPIVLADSATQEAAHATLERPLFEPSRRPREILGEMPGPGSSDALATAILLGLAGTDNRRTALVSVDGKVRRMYPGQAIGPWTLVETDRGSATFRESGGHVRVLTLNRIIRSPPAGADEDTGAREDASQATADRAEAFDEVFPPEGDPNLTEALERRIAERRARREALEARRDR